MSKDATLDGEGIGGADGFLEEGDAYLRVVAGAARRPQVFTPEIVFNVLGMAVEKLMMAILMKAGKLPENHTFRDLLAAFRGVADLEPASRDLLVRMDAHNAICPLGEDYHRSVPSPEEMRTFREVAESIQRLAHERLGG